MKSTVATLLAVLATGVSLPASADTTYTAKLIGGSTDRLCQKLSRDAGVSTPSEAWMNQCRQAARDQDACVTSTGYSAANPAATAATNACWQTFLNRVQSIPKN